MNLTDYPEKIYAQERKEGSNEIYCLDYCIDDEDIEYTRTNLARSDNLTFRERLIGQAMQGLLSNPALLEIHNTDIHRWVAEHSIQQADAIIKQLEDEKK